MFPADPLRGFLSFAGQRRSFVASGPLRNLVERLMIMVSGDRIVAADLASLTGGGATGPVTAESEGAMEALHDARDRFEREYIVRALAAQQGNISRTADVLGVERSNLYRKMRAFGIASPRRGDDDAQS